MANKSSGFGSGAWKFLHFLLLWSRKSNIFRRRIILSLRLMPDYFKSLRSSGSIVNREREFSLEETPVFRLNLNKNKRNKQRINFSRIPCINAAIDVKDDFFYDDHFYQDNEDGNVDDNNEIHLHGLHRDNGGGYAWKEEEVDLKADEFIAEFYKQMKLQRQISYLQYKEMIDRGAN